MGASQSQTNGTTSQHRRETQCHHAAQRQHPLGTYVLDFACLSSKVVVVVAVEVDGSQHVDQAAYDVRRTAWLEGQGYVVLRFWANEILSETDGVVGRIVEVLSTSAGVAPSPTLPQRGRGSIQGNRP